MCGSTKCKQYNIKNAGCMICFGTIPRTPGCTIGACAISSVNGYTSLSSGQSLGEDFIYVVKTDGRSVGSTYKSPEPIFPFTCSDADMLSGLSNETKGMAGLGNGITSLHKQLSLQFKIPHKFAICLPSTSEYAPGHMFIGGGAILFSTICVDHRLVSFNNSLLSIGKDAWGGTALSTTTTFTILRDSIYEALVSAFTKAAAFRKMKRVESVAPFRACYESKSVARSQTGPVVPYIDIGLAGNTHWRFYGANSMVSVNKDILCLAFVGAPVLYTVFVSAFTEAAAHRKMKRVDGPFDVCFNATNIQKRKIGPAVPHIDIGLAGGKNEWRLYGANSMVSVNEELLCLAFVDGGSLPRTSVVIGGLQLENYLIEFDLISSKVGISSSLLTRNTTCSQSRVL
ncbi:putative aspartic proteinase GIP2 [Apium graveolens]